MPDLTPLPTLPTGPNSITRPKTFNADSDATFAVLPAVIAAWNVNVPVFNTNLTLIASSVLAAAASQSAAEESAALAGTHAGTATTKAAEASASAITAAQRLADIEALYDSFDDRYLGVKAFDPVVDNDGNALQAGALYVNSASGFLRAFNGTGWVQGVSAVAGVESINGDQGAITLTPASIGAQPLLVSGVNIKKINGVDVLGEGDVEVQPPLVSGENIKTVGGLPLLGIGDIPLGDVNSRIKTLVDRKVPLSTRLGDSLNMIVALELDNDRDLILVAGSSSTPSAHAVVYDKTTDTFGASVLIDTYTSSSVGVNAITVAADKILVATCAMTKIKGRVLTVSGTTIAVGAAAEITGGSSHYMSLQNPIALGGSYVFQVQRDGNWGLVAMTVSGTTAAIGAWLTMNYSTEGASVLTPHGVILSAIGYGSGVVFFLTSVSGTTLTNTAQAYSSTPGTPGYNCSLHLLSTGRYAAVYSTASSSFYGCILTHSGPSSLSVTAAAYLGSTNTTINLGAVAVGNKVICAGWSAVNVLTDNAGTASAGTPLANAGGSAFSYTASTLLIAGTNYLFEVGIDGTNPVITWSSSQLANSVYGTFSTANAIDFSTGTRSNNVLLCSDGAVIGVPSSSPTCVALKPGNTIEFNICPTGYGYGRSKLRNEKEMWGSSSVAVGNFVMLKKVGVA